MDFNKLFQHIGTVGISKEIDLSFFDNEDFIIDEIGKYDAVVGCCPWLTNGKIIEALGMLSSGACIVTDKNAMSKYIDRSLDKLNKIKALEFETTDLPNSNFFFDQLLRDGANTSAVRVFGKPSTHPTEKPILHYKFLVLCEVNKISRNKIEPKSVITGSFNLSKNATKSREMMLTIKDRYIVQCFYDEWAKAYILSENINSFSSEEINPEFLAANSEREILDKIEAENIWVEKHEEIFNGLSRLYDGDFP